MQNMDPVDENSNTDHTEGRKDCGLHKVLKAILIYVNLSSTLWYMFAQSQNRLTSTNSHYIHHVSMQSDVHSAPEGQDTE